MARRPRKTNADYFAGDLKAIENPVPRLSRLKGLENRISLSLLPALEALKVTAKETEKTTGLLLGATLGLFAVATCVSFFSVYIVTLPVSLSVTVAAGAVFGVTGNAFGRLAGKGLGWIAAKIMKNAPEKTTEEKAALQEQLAKVQNRIGAILSQDGEHYQQSKSWRRLFKKHPGLKDDFAKAMQAKTAASQQNTDMSNWRKLGL